MLNIKKLYVKIDEKEILKDFSLDINDNEIHVIMGPNGCGKSTLTKVLMGDSDYTVTSGTITYNGINVMELSVDKRANIGMFLGMQSPLEVEGVTNADFMRTARHAREKDSFKLLPFIKETEKYMKELDIPKDKLHQNVNEGASGGERKKNEILQMFLLKPSFVMLDEIDSGLDVDSLKLVGTMVTKYSEEFKPAMLLITHYQRLLDYIKPTHVHIMIDGKIIKSGGFELVNEIELEGYTNLNKVS